MTMAFAHRTKLAVSVLFLLSALAASACDDNPARDGWQLVWSDDFEAQGPPDETKWGYEEGFVRNHELQYYTRARKENARVEDGMLVIESRKEKFENPKFDPDAKKRDWRTTRKYADYTSASLITKGKASWTYGRFEIRAKLPTGRGTWPAIWTLGTNFDKVSWPACGEIDIMENVGFDPDVIHFNVHTKKYNHAINSHKGSKTTIAKPYSDFHVYAVEWHPDRLDWFVDDKKYFTFRNEGTGKDVWPFDEPQYLLLNIAIGGDWGGQKGTDDAIFPQRLQVDYVRVFCQKK
jgi:beta-glucanase (GH16 family)